MCQKSQNFLTHLHFCRENFWCLIQCINFFERCDISLLFPLPLSEMKNIFFFCNFRQDLEWEMRNSCRTKTMLSIADIRFLKSRNRFKVFLPSFQRRSSKWRSFCRTFSISSQRKKNVNWTFAIDYKFELAKTRFWVRFTFVKKNAFDQFSNISWRHRLQIVATMFSEMWLKTS